MRSSACKTSTMNQKPTDPSSSSSNGSTELSNSMFVRPAVLNPIMAPYRLLFSSPPTTTSSVRTSHSTTELRSKFLKSKTSQPFKANGSKSSPWLPDHPIVKEHPTAKLLSFKDCFGLKKRPRNDTKKFYPVKKSFINSTLFIRILHKTFDTI